MRAALSRRSGTLAAEVARLVPGLERVAYPGWDALLARWWEAAPPDTILALDEFPALVAMADEIPSLLQKHIDLASPRRDHLVLAGSSRRMMHDLVLDRSTSHFAIAPLYRLLELGLVRRECPFGVPARDSKCTLYRIADPFLRLWFRYVEPNRSRREAQQDRAALALIRRTFSQHAGTVWEDLARESIASLECLGRSWKPAAPWWGTGTHRQALEIDVVTESESGDAVLLGEAEWSERPSAASLPAEVVEKAAHCPFIQGRGFFCALWLKRSAPVRRGARVLGPKQVSRALR